MFANNTRKLIQFFALVAIPLQDISNIFSDRFIGKIASDTLDFAFRAVRSAVAVNVITPLNIRKIFFVCIGVIFPITVEVNTAKYLISSVSMTLCSSE